MCGAAHYASTVHLCSSECPLKEISKGAGRDVNASGMWCSQCFNVIPNIFNSQGSWNTCLLFILVHMRAGLLEQDVAAPANVEFKSTNILLSCDAQDCRGSRVYLSTASLSPILMSMNLLIMVMLMFFVFNYILFSAYNACHMSAIIDYFYFSILHFEFQKV